MLSIDRVRTCRDAVRLANNQRGVGAWFLGRVAMMG